MLTFIGLRTSGTTAVFVRSGEANFLGVLTSEHGDARGCFEWGYGGVGPRYLARAILLAVTKDQEVADSLCMRFKWDRISKLRGPFWMIHQEEVEVWIIEQVAKLAPPADDDLVDLGLGGN